MKKILLLSILVFAGCSNLTPDQINAYGNAGQNIVNAGLSDYKQVVEIENKKPSK